MNAGAGLLGEAELHGLVDGHLEADRRADVLRKLAASPADRALIEGWQGQNDLIRAAFRDVERETLPVALDLAPARLRCIEGDLDPALAPIRALRLETSTGRGRNAIATAAALLVVAVGMAGAWLLINQGDRDDGTQSAASPAPAKLETTLEATLADRATTALEAAGRSAAATGLARVPNLTAAGLRLTGVSTQAGELGTVILQYRDADDGRVVLGLAGAPDTAPKQASSVGRTIAWRRGGTAYALAGTVPAERLRRLARSMQDETGQD